MNESVNAHYLKTHSIIMKNKAHCKHRKRISHDGRVLLLLSNLKGKTSGSLKVIVAGQRYVWDIIVKVGMQQSSYYSVLSQPHVKTAAIKSNRACLLKPAAVQINKVQRKMERKVSILATLGLFVFLLSPDVLSF